jgi:hypothetical protein
MKLKIAYVNDQEFTEYDVDPSKTLDEFKEWIILENAEKAITQEQLNKAKDVIVVNINGRNYYELFWTLSSIGVKENSKVQLYMDFQKSMELLIKKSEESDNDPNCKTQ